MRSQLGKEERWLSFSSFAVIHLEVNYCIKYSFMI